MSDTSKTITISAHDLEQRYVSRISFGEMCSALENQIGTLQALDIANTAIIKRLRADLAAAQEQLENEKFERWQADQHWNTLQQEVSELHALNLYDLVGDPDPLRAEMVSTIRERDELRKGLDAARKQTGMAIASAEYDKAGLRAELAESVANAQRLEKERNRLKELVEGNAREVVLESMHFADGVMDFYLEHPIFGLFAATIVEMFRSTGAQNYLETRMFCGDLGAVTFTCQRQEGKSPHELRLIAEAERDMTEGLFQNMLGLGREAERYIDDPAATFVEFAAYVRRWVAENRAILDLEAKEKGGTDV